MIGPLRAALLLSALSAPLAALAQTAPTSAAVPPIAFTQRTLANGLQVYAIRDPHAANVAIQVWYKVGGKDDPAGRSGFAHLFEHLMFKATRNLPPEQFDRLTEDVGGANNASTNDDYTEYHESVPANHLQRLLFAEADRMAGLVVDQADFTSERAVVEEELRSRVLAAPYGQLLYSDVAALSYAVHPYARGVIGSIANLDSATLDDVRAFHATYYRPDNAVLVVAGNFDPAELDRWVDQYFAPIKRPGTAIPRVTVAEPARAAAVRRVVYEPNTPLPAVLLSYPIPPDTNADIPALTVLGAILATGDSSRLHEALVYGQGLAQDVKADVDSRQQQGLFTTYAILAAGKGAAAGEAALRREIGRLRDAPVSAAELARAKTQLLTDAIRERETPEGVSRALAGGVVIDGDPRANDRQLAAIAAVTAADVQRVARAYLGENRSAAIHYLPRESKPAGAAGDTLEIAATVQTRPLAAPADLAVVTLAPPGERVQPPLPGPPTSPHVPRPTLTRLANGVTVVTIERHDLPLVTASLVVEAGSALDPAGHAGAAALAAEVMTKGTLTRSATQIAAEAESLGASLASEPGRDTAHLDMTVRADKLVPALAIIADVAEHPRFAPDEIERARGQAIDAATVTLGNPGSVAALAANRAVFGDTGYGESTSGTPTSLRAVTRADLTAAYARAWRPDAATLILVGDITPGAARAAAESALGTWRAPGVPARIPTNPAPTTKPRVIVIDMPDAGQAGVVVARPAIGRADPGYHWVELANSVLGGGYSSRLNIEVRVKRGLAYGAGSGISARRGTGIVAAATQTKNPSAAEVAQLVVAEMRRLGATPPAPAELDARKAALVGDFGRETETTAGLAGLLREYVVYDVPLSELQSYGSVVQAISGDQVSTAARTMLDPGAATIVVAGDAKQFMPALRHAYPQVEVIPLTQLNLDRAALR